MCLSQDFILVQQLKTLFLGFCSSLAAVITVYMYMYLPDVQSLQRVMNFVFVSALNLEITGMFARARCVSTLTYK